MQPCLAEGALPGELLGKRCRTERITIDKGEGVALTLDLPDCYHPREPLALAPNEC
ncbi:hypothetical protein BH20CHL5_BH20CHL5_10010 [soil metagenome]|jgi:hypothetical protein